MTGVQTCALPISDKEYINLGKKLLLSPGNTVNELEVIAEGFENSKRKVELIKVQQAYHLFKELIIYYGVNKMIDLIGQNKIKSFDEFKKTLPSIVKRTAWVNAGGQLIQQKDLEQLKSGIKSGKIKSWEQVHNFYKKAGDNYSKDKLAHAFASLLEILSIALDKIDKPFFKQLLQEAIDTKEWITKGIYESRAKDYSNPFRKMVYENDAEMEAVTGKLQDNSFIKLQDEELEAFKKQVKALIKKFKL